MKPSGYNYLFKLSIIVVFILFSIILISRYIMSEHYIYTWDWAIYWNKFLEMRNMWSMSCTETIDFVIKSVRKDDYNYFSPFLLQFSRYLGLGSDRTDFILSTALLFGLPVYISYIILIAKNSTSIGWKFPKIIISSVFLFLVQPIFWGPILKGVLGVEGMSLIFLLLIIFLHEVKRRENSFLPYIAYSLLSVILIIIRRWYIFWVLSFWIVILIYSVWIFVTDLLDRKKFNWLIFNYFLTGSITIILLKFALGSVFFNFTHTDYRTLYSAYKSGSSLMHQMQTLP